MTLKNGDRFTVYDAMEASGYFTNNPANPNSRDKNGQALYSGPVKFPMMLYHPTGREHVVVPGTRERTPYGTVEVFGEQSEIISMTAASEEELQQALAEGWHKHPAMAIKAGNETWRKAQGIPPVPVPAITASSRISELEEQNKRLTEALEEAKRMQRELRGDDADDEPAARFVPPSKILSNVAKAGLV